MAKTYTVYDEKSEATVIADNKRITLEIVSDSDSDSKLRMTIKRKTGNFVVDTPMFNMHDVADLAEYLTADSVYTHITDNTRLMEVDNSADYPSDEYTQFLIVYKDSVFCCLLTSEDVIDSEPLQLACIVAFADDTFDILDLDGIYVENSIESCSFDDMTGGSVYDNDLWEIMGENLLALLPMCFFLPEDDSDYE